MQPELKLFILLISIAGFVILPILANRKAVRREKRKPKNTKPQGEFFNNPTPTPRPTCKFENPHEPGIF